MFGLRRQRQERTGYVLYGAAVAASRDPALYLRFGVPDTLDGRFDMIGLHVWLVIRRLTALPPPGPDTAQALFDAFFSDMDQNLRQMGVGDLSVGKKVRRMWEAFHGRCAAYEVAIGAEDPADLAAALGRNVWRVEPPPPEAAALAAHVRGQDAHLAAQDAAALLAGNVEFRTAAA